MFRAEESENILVGLEFKTVVLFLLLECKKMMKNF